MLILFGWRLRLLQILILARCVLSFVPRWQYSPFGQLIIVLTEPILRPLRSVVKFGGAGMALDFSPMIALVIISVLSRVLGR